MSRISKSFQESVVWHQFNDIKYHWRKYLFTQYRNCIFSEKLLVIDLLFQNECVSYTVWRFIIKLRLSFPFPCELISWLRFIIAIFQNDRSVGKTHVRFTICKKKNCFSSTLKWSLTKGSYITIFVFFLNIIWSPGLIFSIQFSCLEMYDLHIERYSLQVNVI